MAATEKIFEAIKTMSKKTLNSQHRILLNDIASDLKLSKDNILVSLLELEYAGYIKIHRSKIISVALTNHGLQSNTYVR